MLHLHMTMSHKNVAAARKADSDVSVQNGARAGRV